MRSIVFPVWAFDDARRQVAEASYLSFAATPDVEMVIVDNGSYPPFVTGDWKRRYWPANRGYAQAIQAGLEMAEGDHVAVGSCDIIVPEGWLELLCTDGIAGPYEKGNRRRDLRYRGSFYSPLWVVSREVVETVPWDVSWGNFADRDYAIRVARAGYPIRRVEVEVEHRDPHRSVEQMERSEITNELARFRRTYGASGFGDWERKHGLDH